MGINYVSKFEKISENILGKPTYVDLVDNALRIRRNLIASSAISLFIYYNNLSIGASTNVLGVQFTNLSPTAISSGLALLIIYFMLHYGWYIVDTIQEWRIRLTGTNGSLINIGWGTEGRDYGPDSRQFTLYYWWNKNRDNLESLNIDAIEKLSKELVDHCNNIKLEPSNQLVTLVNNLTASVQDLSNKMIPLHNLLKDERIEASLYRFDNAFFIFRNSQNARWLILDVLFPFGLGLWASAVMLLGKSVVLPTVVTL